MPIGVITVNEDVRPCNLTFYYCNTTFIFVIYQQTGEFGILCGLVLCDRNGDLVLQIRVTNKG